MVLPDPTLYRVFLLATIVVLLIPGPAVAYVLARSVDHGRVAGIVSATGLALGDMFHVAAATVGLSAILASSAIAFSAIKYAGAAYLIYVGIHRLREKDDAEAPATSPRSLRRIFTQGVIVNVLNPKIALFFLAFLPQFADPSRGSLAWQIFFLGTSLALIGVFTDGLSGGTIGGLLKKSARARRSERYVTGGIYITLGVGAALTGHGKK